MIRPRDGAHPGRRGDVWMHRAGQYRLDSAQVCEFDTMDGLPALLLWFSSTIRYAYKPPPKLSQYLMHSLNFLIKTIFAFY